MPFEQSWSTSTSIIVHTSIQLCLYKKYLYIMLVLYNLQKFYRYVYKYIQNMCKGVNVDRAGGATDFKLNTVQGSHLCVWKSFAMASSIGDVCEAARAGLGNLLFFHTWWCQKPKLEKERERPSRVRTPESLSSMLCDSIRLSWKQIRIKTFGNFQGECMVTGCFSRQAVAQSGPENHHRTW